MVNCGLFKSYAIALKLCGWMYVLFKKIVAVGDWNEMINQKSCFFALIAYDSNGMYWFGCQRFAWTGQEWHETKHHNYKWNGQCLLIRNNEKNNNNYYNGRVKKRVIVVFSCGIRVMYECTTSANCPMNILISFESFSRYYCHYFMYRSLQSLFSISSSWICSGDVYATGE